MTKRKRGRDEKRKEKKRKRGKEEKRKREKSGKFETQKVCDKEEEGKTMSCQSFLRVSAALLKERCSRVCVCV